MDTTKTKWAKSYYAKLEKRREKLLSVTVKNLPNEIWKDIEGYLGHYMVSNFSRIKSIGRMVNRNNGVAVKPSQLLKPAKNSDGYLCVVLTKDKVSDTFSLHRVVAKHFIHNPYDFPEVNHKDGNKLNCLPSNLEWNSRKQNIQHSVNTGLRKYSKGVDYNRLKLSKEKVIEIYNDNQPSGFLVKKYGVTKSSIQRIKNGRTHSKITNHNNNGLD